MILTFSKRANVTRPQSGGIVKTYKASNGRHLVIHVKHADGAQKWLAGLALADGSQLPISRHKTRKAAEEACQRHKDKG